MPFISSHYSESDNSATFYLFAPFWFFGLFSNRLVHCFIEANEHFCRNDSRSFRIVLLFFSATFRWKQKKVSDENRTKQQYSTKWTHKKNISSFSFVFHFQNIWKLNCLLHNNCNKCTYVLLVFVTPYTLFKCFQVMMWFCYCFWLLLYFLSNCQFLSFVWFGLALVSLSVYCCSHLVETISVFWGSSPNNLYVFYWFSNENYVEQKKTTNHQLLLFSHENEGGKK